MRNKQADKSKSMDKRFMAAAIRLARRNEGLTGTNPSVACVVVRTDGAVPYIVGSAITAKGGRPHAETIALDEAGEFAKGATAYVTLEPCAHHGSTPSCAQMLIDAGIARVVSAVADPDDRVNGKGHAKLKNAGVETVMGCLAVEAAIGLAPYLLRKAKNRAYVTLKLALSADGYIGKRGAQRVAITGPLANSQSQLLRAKHHAILVGAQTVIDDDPELTCRLEGLNERSPVRIVLDPNGRVPLNARLFKTAKQVRTLVVAPSADNTARCEALEKLGVEIFNCEIANGRVALPELLEDLAAVGFMSVMVEGGAQTAQSFLDDDLVNEMVLYAAPTKLAVDHRQTNLVKSSITPASVLTTFTKIQSLKLGDDVMSLYLRNSTNRER